MQDKVKYINEKFTEDSDPIHDMGIGVREAIKDFLKKKGIDASQSSDDHLLSHCAKYGEYDYVKYLMRYVDLKSENFYGLAIAAEKGYLDIVELLHKNGANITGVSFCAVNWTSATNHFDVMEYLLKNGANPNGERDGGDPLINAVGGGYIDMAKLLLKYGANPMAQSKYNNSSTYNYPLEKACQENKVDIAKILIDARAPVDEHSFMYSSFLVEASEKGNKDIVELLLKNGADVHYNDDEALQMACSHQHFEIVKLLLENGANPRARGGAAIRRALRNKNQKIVDLLKKYYKNKMNEQWIKRGTAPGMGNAVPAGHQDPSALDEQMMGVGTTPGMGNVVPPSTTSFGSGDNFGAINKKPYTQGGKVKTKKKRKTMKKKRLEEENTNPYDQVANIMIKRMGKETKSPFKKKREKGNQNAMVQRNYEHEILTFDDFKKNLNENK